MVKSFNIKILAIIISLFVCISLFAQTKKTLSIKATYYHDRFENKYTSSGEKFSQKLYTAAHRALPFNTVVRVTNPKTSRSILVRINDRCARDGVIDLSKNAARKIDLLAAGVATVKMEILTEEYLQLWAQQEELFAMFDATNMNEEYRTHYMDSLYKSLGNKVILDTVYYIKLLTVDSEKEAMKILSSLTEEYKQQSKCEKVYNETFYNILIGPFASKEVATLNLIKLRRRYNSAHIIKNKNNNNT